MMNFLARWKDKPLFWFSIVIGVWGIFSLITVFLPDLSPNTDFSKNGQFGDSFGALNTLFSGLAFAGIIYSILLQERELAATREELKGQKEQLELQVKALDLQNFEASFFILLKFINQASNQLSINGVKGIYAVTNQFVYMEDFDGVGQKTDTLNTGMEIVVGLDLYINAMCNIFYYIDASRVEEKSFYSDILLSSLTDNDIYLMFLICLSNRRESKKLKAYIEKYSAFRLVNDLFSPDEKRCLAVNKYKDLFSSSAFGETKNET